MEADEIGSTEMQCPSDAFLSLLKGKCKTTLLVLIHKGRNRFGELRRTLPTLSERMLSRQLDELERDGLIARTSYPEVPPRVEYTLTAYGETLYPIVREMRRWGHLHLAKTASPSLGTT